MLARLEDRNVLNTPSPARHGRADGTRATGTTTTGAQRTGGAGGIVDASTMLGGV